MKQSIKENQRIFPEQYPAKSFPLSILPCLEKFLVKVSMSLINIFLIILFLG